MHAFTLPAVNGYRPVFWHVDLSAIIYRILTTPGVAESLVFEPEHADHPTELWHGLIWRQSPLFTINFIQHNAYTYKLGANVVVKSPAYRNERGQLIQAVCEIGQLAAIYWIRDTVRSMDGSMLHTQRQVLDIRMYCSSRTHGSSSNNVHELYLTDRMMSAVHIDQLVCEVEVLPRATFDKLSRAGRIGDQLHGHLRFYFCTYFQCSDGSKMPIEQARILPSRKWEHPPQPPAGMKVKRIFLSMFYDGFGAFNRSNRWKTHQYITHMHTTDVARAWDIE